MRLNFKKDVDLNPDNFFKTNPVIKGDVKRKKFNGKYVYEEFYLIDFLDIKENSYVISSFGRLFSLITNQEIKGYGEAQRNNYRTVILRTKDGKNHKFPIHRLVARAFIPKTVSDKKMNRVYVHHKNWDNDYNYYWNLEWRSPMEILVLNRIQTSKELTEEELVNLVCALLERKETIVDIFDLLKGMISKDKISKIKNRLIYQSISSNYNF